MQHTYTYDIVLFSWSRDECFFMIDVCCCCCYWLLVVTIIHCDVDYDWCLLLFIMLMFVVIHYVDVCCFYYLWVIHDVHFWHFDVVNDGNFDNQWIRWSWNWSMIHVHFWHFDVDDVENLTPWSWWWLQFWHWRCWWCWEFWHLQGDDDENFDIEDVHDDFLLMDEVLCCEFWHSIMAENGLVSAGPVLAII